MLIGRGNTFIVPKSATAIESRDRLLVLADREDLALTRQVVESQTPAPATSLK